MSEMAAMVVSIGALSGAALNLCARGITEGDFYSTIGGIACLVCAVSIWRKDIV
jgi:hypothetical protein